MIPFRLTGNGGAIETIMLCWLSDTSVTFDGGPGSANKKCQTVSVDIDRPMKVSYLNKTQFSVTVGKQDLSTYQLQKSELASKGFWDRPES